MPRCYKCQTEADGTFRHQGLPYCAACWKKAIKKPESLWWESDIYIFKILKDPTLRRKVRHITNSVKARTYDEALRKLCGSYLKKPRRYEVKVNYLRLRKES